MKLYIFGSVASGKTTLAKKLSEQMGLPYYEGDSIAWGFPEEERFKRTPEQQKERIAAIDAAGDWIVEGAGVPHRAICGSWRTVSSFWIRRCCCAKSGSGPVFCGKDAVRRPAAINRRSPCCA